MENFILEYIKGLYERAKDCNKKIYRYYFLFLSTMTVSYLVDNLNITQINLFSITANIPRSLIIGVTPFILVYYLYSVSCFTKLEGYYCDELQKVWKNLESEGKIQLTEWQTKLLDIPSHVMLSELQDLTSHSRFFLIGRTVINISILFLFLLPPIIIGFFSIRSWIIIESQLLLVLHVVSIFIAIYSIAILFVKENPKKV